MAYQLQSDETLIQSVRRIAYEQLEKTIQCLREQPDGQQAAIHSARKHLKKLRALVRLAKPKSKEWSRKAKDVFKTAGKMLSSTRDADVLQETAERFKEQHEQELGSEIFEQLLALLENRRGDTAPDADSLSRSVAEIITELEHEQSEIDDWKIPGQPTSVVFRNFSSGYKKCLKSMKVALKEQSDSAWHEWRKNCKTYWYHLRLMRDIWPRMMKPMISACSELCDLLGEDHDLAVLQTVITLKNRELRHNESVDIAVNPVEKYREFLETQGLRMTHERSIIIEEIFSLNEPFNAELLVQRLKYRRDCSRVSRSSIYRSIALLEEAGSIQEVADQKKCEPYEHDQGSLNRNFQIRQSSEKTSFERLQAVILEQRLELQTKAIHLGTLVFAESKKANRRRLSRYWLHWRKHNADE